GPVLARAIAVPGIFAMTGILALLALAVVKFIVPDSGANAHPVPAAPSRFSAILRHPDLLRLNVGIFVLHAVLMALFVVVPFGLRDAGLPAANHWQVYLPVMVGSVLLMAPPMIVSERRGEQKLAFIASIALLFVAQLMLALLFKSLFGLVVALLVFFTSFNFLEASLPALISRVAPADAKGTAVGVYSSVQFLGTFAGAAVGGAVSEHSSATSVFIVCAVLTLVWLGASIGMRVPSKLRTRTYTVPAISEQQAQGLSRELLRVPGVREAMVLVSEGVARLTVDSARFDEQDVLRLISGEVR